MEKRKSGNREIGKRGKRLIAGIAVLVAASSWGQTPVRFPMRELTGSDQVRAISIVPLDPPVVYQGVIYNGSTIVAYPKPGGVTNSLGQPVSGLTTNLIGGNFRITYAGLPRAFTQLYVPFGFTNGISAADPAYQRTLGIMQVFNFTNMMPGGAILYDPVAETVQQAARGNLVPYWTGKGTSNAWQFFNGDGFTLNTNCWTYGLDFSGLAAGALNALFQTNGVDDIALITPQHGVTAQHYWSGYVGMPVIFTAVGGALYTNFVAGFTNPAADIELITFSNAAPAGVNPFWVLPSNAMSYVPTNLFGDEVVWLRNNAGTAGGPHMNLQVTDDPSAQSEIGASSQGEPTVPFFDLSATSGDSGGPVWMVLSDTAGVLRPVFLYSLRVNWVAGPWVSYAGYLPIIQGLVGTNQLRFVDMTRYQGTVPSLPPNGTVNEHSSALGMAQSLTPSDALMSVRNLSGKPSTQLITLSNLFYSLMQLPGWPSNVSVVISGGGTNGANLLVTTNTFTGPNTFSGAFEVDGAGNYFGPQQYWSPVWVNQQLYADGDLFVIHSRVFGFGKSLWFANPTGGHTNAVLFTADAPGSELQIYAGTNMDRFAQGGAGVWPVSIKDRAIYGDTFGSTNLGGGIIRWKGISNPINGGLAYTNWLQGGNWQGVGLAWRTPVNDGDFLWYGDGQDLHFPNGFISDQGGIVVGNLEMSMGNIYGGLGGGSNLPPAGITSGGAALGQVMGFNGTNWVPMLGIYFTNGVLYVNGGLTLNSTTNTDWTINDVLAGWLEVSNSIAGLNFTTPTNAATSTFLFSATTSGGRPSTAWVAAPAASANYSNITENAYQVNIRSNLVAPSTLMSSNSTGTATIGPGYIALTGTNAQPGQWTMYNGNTNATFFFDGTNLYVSGFSSITNPAGLSIQTALNNTTNSVIALGNNVTNGAVTQLSNYVNTVSQNLTNIAATMEQGSTGNQGVPAATVAFYAINGNGITNLMTSDISTFTRSLTTSKVKMGPFRVLVSGNPGAFADKIEVFTNGVLSSISIAVNNVTSGVDSTHTETVIAGVEIGIKITSATGSAPVKWSWALEERIVP